MDLPSPRTEQHVQFYEDEEHAHSLWHWASSIKPAYKVLCVVLFSLILAALAFSSVPLWRPMGALLLHKLLEVLKFLVLATSIGLGILNSRLWRDTDTEAHCGKEDSSSKVPLVAMFYGYKQHSYSLSDNEMKVSDYGLISKSESERDGGAGAAGATSMDGEHDAGLKDVSTATLPDGHHRNEASLRASNDLQSPCAQPNTAVVSSSRGISQEEDGPAASETKGDIASNNMRRNAANVASRGKNRLLQPYDDLGLAVAAQQPKHSSSKIVHRRGSSLEYHPIAQNWGASILEDGTPPHQNPPSLDKTTPSTAAVRVKKNGAEPPGSIPSSPQAERVEGRAPGATLKHRRSRSAYNVDELLIQHRQRRKPSTSQSSERRNLSLCCDLNKQYGAKGCVPPWLSGIPSPPEPPVMYSYDTGETKGVPADIPKTKQDESTLRKAFTESLAPWRAATPTAPVDIPTHTRKAATQSDKDSLARTMAISRVRKQAESTRSSSPSNPNTMGSPSPGELNKKVDAFIARFHERMRLQRLESLERSRQRRG